MGSPKLGVGIVGANWAARGHLPAWRMLPDRIRPLGICTRSAEPAQASAAVSLGRLFAAMVAAIEDRAAPPQPDFARGALVPSIVAAIGRSEIERRWVRVDVEDVFRLPARRSQKEHPA